MAINRRRAPSSEVSSEKKLAGHKHEQDYATMIEGSPISGTQKGDVKDKKNNLHSVKSGKKWQILLYGYTRISESTHLSILKPCLDAFPDDSKKYFEDRIKCISHKEEYISLYGKEKAMNLANDLVIKHMGPNVYIESKAKLEKAVLSVCNQLKDKNRLKKFLEEALFNNTEVEYLAIKDSTYKKDELFKVFAKQDVLEIFSDRIFPAISIAGRAPQDYNVAGQKTLLCYKKANGKPKNIVEIEIRNDSDRHYRQVRFNMYSKDALLLLLTNPRPLSKYEFSEHVMVYGRAKNAFT